MAPERDIDWFNYFDEYGGIAHILQKINHGCTSRTDVTTELSDDADNDVLQEIRLKLFNFCKCIFEANLKEQNKLEEGKETNFKLLRRTKSGDNTSLSKDIVDLYEFAIGGVDRFPKNVLTKSSCKHIEIPMSNSQVQKQSPVKRQDVLLAKINTVELTNKVREQDARIETLERESKECKVNSDKQLDDMKKQIHDLQKLVTQIQAVCGVIPVQQGTLNGTAAAASTEIESSTGSPTLDNPAQEVIDLTPARESTDLAKDQSATTPNDEAPSSHSGQSHMFPPGVPPVSSTTEWPSLGTGTMNVRDDSGNFTTVTYRRTPGTTNEQLRQGISHNINRIQNGQQGSMMQNHPPPSTGNSSYPGTGLLTGIRRENGTTLYIEGIHVADNTAYEAIGNNVKTYAKSKGIRIMAIRIIRNRFCDDAVGARILVPSSQEYLALDPATWPSNILCRRWESRPRKMGQYKRHSDNGYRRQGYNEERNGHNQQDYNEDYGW